MALTVETGAGLSNADSYLSVANADTYHQNHGDPNAWKHRSLVDKEEALRMATQYMDSRYDWAGNKAAKANALDWPRTGVYDREDFRYTSTEIPQRIKDACAELALRHLSLTNGLLPDPSRTAAVKREKVDIGGLIEEIEYIGSDSLLPVFPKVELILIDFTEDDTELARA